MIGSTVQYSLVPSCSGVCELSWQNPLTGLNRHSIYQLINGNFMKVELYGLCKKSYMIWWFGLECIQEKQFCCALAAKLAVSIGPWSSICSINTEFFSQTLRPYHQKYTLSVHLLQQWLELQLQQCWSSWWWLLYSQQSSGTSEGKLQLTMIVCHLTQNWRALV